MSKQSKQSLKVEKNRFDAVLRKMLNTPPVPMAKLPKRKKKLARIIETSKV